MPHGRGHLGGFTSNRFSAIGVTRGHESGIDAEPAQWFGFPGRGAVTYPGQRSDLVAVVQNEGSQRPTCKVRSTHAVTNVTTGPGDPGIAIKTH